MALPAYPRFIATAQCASNAASELLRAALKDDTAETHDVITQLADAARLVIQTAGESDRDGQLLGALVKWLEENA